MRSASDAVSRALFVTLAASAVSLGGCGKTMTKEECQRVGAHMRKVWDREAESSAPEKGPRSERAANVIKSEGDKMEAEWKTLCERELEGRKVDEQEVECFLAAKNVEEIHGCAAARR